jgi:hypothetical protein
MIVELAKRKYKMGSILKVLLITSTILLNYPMAKAENTSINICIADCHQEYR